MKILQTTLGFYPAVGWGGPVKIVYENSKELIDRGHQVTVYCTNLMDKKNYIQKGTYETEIDGIRVVYFHTFRIPQWPGTLGPIWLPDMKKYLDKECQSFDVIHINGYRNLMNLAVSTAARRNNVPFVIQPHGGLPIIVNSHFIKRVYDKVLGGQELLKVGAIIALQESERQQALEHGIPDDLIKIIPNGLNLSSQPKMQTFGAFRKKYQIPLSSPVILFLGRINKKKGTDMLVKAFSQLLDLDPYLVIAGPDDGQLEEVKALIAEYDLQEKVRLTGLLAGEDIASAYQDSDLFALPCRADTFPTTILEACFYELPMVITDRCESADIVKDKVADIVPFDIEAFALGMRRLIVDRNHYSVYKQNCPKLMQEQFSVSSTVNRLESVYRQVIEKSKLKSSEEMRNENSF